MTFARKGLMSLLMATFSALGIAGTPQATSGKPAPDVQAWYIVHLKSPPLALTDAEEGEDSAGRRKFDRSSEKLAEHRARIQEKQAVFEKSLAEKLGRTPPVAKRFQVALNAMVMKITPREATILRTLSDVSLVERVSWREKHTDRGPAVINAPGVWQGAADLPATKGEGVIVGIIDSGTTPGHRSFADIGDDGYNHTNPFGSGHYFGDCREKPELCNDKLIGIITYPDIIESFEGKVPPYGIDYDGHGTHVASTAAGNVLKNIPGYNSAGLAGEYKFPQISGVAPHANIISYQVCYANDPSCNPLDAVEAVEHAIENGVDVLNYSIGGGVMDPWLEPDSLAFLSARAAGIHVAISAGNSGSRAESISSPANAPWVISVGATTHGRVFEFPKLLDFTGGASLPGTEMTGWGVTREFSGPVVLAEDHGDALCLNPFAAGTFNGEIVVCKRGENARAQKGANVKAGGAGGMILIDTDNTQLPVRDFHVLPAIHLNVFDGQALLDWLANGTGHQARITAAGPTEDLFAADSLANFSSRGPVSPYGNYLAPSVSAPGVDIYAAFTDTQPFSGAPFEVPFNFLSGTSMASPHVAGALALLTDLHPDWTPAEAQSALMMTASDNVNDEGNYAGPLQRGSGRIDVARAANAGLVMNITAAEYRTASPGVGGNPAALNIPALVDNKCMVSCSWTRRLRASRAGSWVVDPTVYGGAGVIATPGEFTLAVGQEQEIVFTADVTNATPGEWADGKVEFVPADNAAGRLHFPVAVRALNIDAPENINLYLRNTTGVVTVPALSAPNASVTTITHKSGKPDIYRSELPDDPTPQDWLDNYQQNAQVVSLDVADGTGMVIAEIIQAEALDLDLYVGRDTDGDGQPSLQEILSGYVCVSAGGDSNERCELNDLEAGKYWVVVHKYFASMVGSVEAHTLAITRIDDSSDTVEFAVQPRGGNLFDMSFAWNDPPLTDGAGYALVSIQPSGTPADNATPLLVTIKSLADNGWPQGSIYNVTADRTEATAGQSIEYVWSVEELGEWAAARTVLVTMDLPEDYTLLSATEQPVAEGNRLMWTHEQKADDIPEIRTRIQIPANAQAGSLTLPFVFRTLQNDKEIDIIQAPAVRIKPAPTSGNPPPSSEPGGNPSEQPGGGGGPLELMILGLLGITATFRVRR